MRGTCSTPRIRRPLLVAEDPADRLRGVREGRLQEVMEDSQYLRPQTVAPRAVERARPGLRDLAGEDRPFWRRAGVDQLRAGRTSRPPGFIKAALQNNATVSSAGGNTLMTFTTPDGQKVTGTLNAMRLVSKVATTNPVTNAPVEANFSNYRTFDGMRFPSHIVQLEGGATVADLSVTAVRANQGVGFSVPEPVRQLAQPAGRSN